MTNAAEHPMDSDQIIDADGYRLNVGIIITNGAGELFWARNNGRRFWQFPQGGISPGETPEQALYRELEEEVGLRPEHVKVIGSTASWLSYDLPSRYIRRHQNPLCIGQKQMWYMLELTADESVVRFDSTQAPEFDHFRWVDYWQPLREVVFFKRSVYRQALDELAPLLFPQGAPPRPKGLMGTKRRFPRGRRSERGLEKERA